MQTFLTFPHPGGCPDAEGYLTSDLLAKLHLWDVSYQIPINHPIWIGTMDDFSLEGTTEELASFHKWFNERFEREDHLNPKKLLTVIREVEDSLTATADTVLPAYGWTETDHVAWMVWAVKGSKLKPKIDSKPRIKWIFGFFNSRTGRFMRIPYVREPSKGKLGNQVVVSHAKDHIPCRRLIHIICKNGQMIPTYFQPQVVENTIRVINVGKSANHIYQTEPGLDEDATPGEAPNTSSSKRMSSTSYGNKKKKVISSHEDEDEEDDNDDNDEQEDDDEEESEEEDEEDEELVETNDDEPEEEEVLPKKPRRLVQDTSEERAVPFKKQKLYPQTQAESPLVIPRSKPVITMNDEDDERCHYE